MKLAFWSSAKGKAGITSNMACISVVAALGYSYKAILFENHYQQNDIGHMIKYHHVNLLNSLSRCHIKSMGMDHIMKSLSFAQFINFSKSSYGYNYGIANTAYVLNDSRGRTNKDYMSDITNIIKEATLEIVDNYVYYLPTSAMIPQNIYDFGLYDHVKSILKGAEELADIIYIDTSKENHLSTKIILDEVDLVVVNLNQDFSVIKHFFNNYSSLLEKCVFLISNYSPVSYLNIDKISNIFSVSKSKIAVIPYNEEYQEALLRGSLVEFLSRNIDCGHNDPMYPFIDEVQKAVTMILMGSSMKTKEE